MINRRPAFSLIEMLVSLGVLVVALGVVSNIFALTAKTASTSVAISETQGKIRAFMAELKADLEAVNTAESVLVIRGGLQAAALDSDRLDAQQYTRFLIGDSDQVGNFDPVFSGAVNAFTDQYTNPRTDILGFLTTRQVSSRAPALGNPGNSFQYALQNGARVGPSWITYGHAARANVTANGGWPSSANDEHIFTNGGQTLSPLPLTDWHLARRVTLLNLNLQDKNTTLPFEVPSNLGSGNWLVSAATNNFAGDAVNCDFETLLANFSAAASYRPYGNFGSSWRAATGVTQGLTATVNTMLHGVTGGAPVNVRHVATVLRDVSPTTASNRGLTGLPGCAYFQVEFLMPEDGRNAPQSSGAYRYARDRWVEVTPGDTYVFVPDTPQNRQSAQFGTFGTSFRSGDFTVPVPPGGGGTMTEPNYRIWPYAVRITIRVYDAEGRLDQPIIRTLVHRFP